MAIQAYLNFRGNCREAVEFYAEAFGVERQPILTYGDGPADSAHTLDERTRDLVMHTTLNVLGATLMFSDVTEDMPFTAGNNISLMLSSPDPDVLTAIFNRLKQSGTVDMELQATFWSKLYGAVTDKFGVPWQVNHEECALDA